MVYEAYSEKEIYFFRDDTDCGISGISDADRKNSSGADYPALEHGTDVIDYRRGSGRAGVKKLGFCRSGYGYSGL